MRLNKYISQAGIASRRKADELIISGKVAVGGKTVTEPFYDVEKGESVAVDGKDIYSAAKKVYFILNKPKGYITTTTDEQDRPTVMDLVKDVPERVFPVGRLDGPTTGLLIMTNDGDFAYRLMHPKFEKTKTYRAYIRGVVSKEKAGTLRKGVDIGGYKTLPAEVQVIKQNVNNALVEIKIREGRNRQVRKMFAVVGLKVVELERVAIGDVYLGHLKTGHIRKMTRSEIESLLLG
jgi:23S rRNA pseudouridine2605 synthase